MTSHRPSRWLAPLALIAAIAAVGLVVSGTMGDEEPDQRSNGASQERPREERGSTDRERPGSDETDTGTETSTTAQPTRRTYTVRPGDTLALIAERTGVPVETLLELNPGIDPNSLTVGERVKLRE